MLFKQSFRPVYHSAYHFIAYFDFDIVQRHILQCATCSLEITNVRTSQSNAPFSIECETDLWIEWKYDVSEKKNT